MYGVAVDFFLFIQFGYVELPKFIKWCILLVLALSFTTSSSFSVFSFQNWLDGFGYFQLYPSCLLTSPTFFISSFLCIIFSLISFSDISSSFANLSSVRSDLLLNPSISFHFNYMLPTRITSATFLKLVPVLECFYILNIFKAYPLFLWPS